MGADTARFALISRLVFVIAACGACAARSGPNDFPELVEHEGKEIEEVHFEGAESFSLDTLRTLVETKASRCSLLGLPVCVPFTNFGQQEHHLDPGRVTADARRLELFYRSEGYFGTAVTPRAEPYAEDVIVTFDIERGDPVILDSLSVSGTEGVLDPDSLLRAMPLEAGGIFDLRRFGAAADTLLRALQARGHVYAVVLRNFTVDTLRDRATASLDAIPGPQVTVDSIVLTGAEHLGRDAAVRQLTVREGDLLRQSDLVESQRNLYALELVRFANVTLAADSLRRAPADSTKATVLVSIAEAPVYQVDAAIGFGTVECFRTEMTWENRSFGSGARQLTLTGSLSKIGIATGLSNVLCNEFQGDEFAGKLDYRAAADLVQPYFLSPRNNLNLSLFVERQSQPRIFQREAVGGQFGFSRRLAARTVLTGAIDVERGSTEASPVIFCAAFEVCEPTDIERLSAPRFRNTIGASVLRDRSDVPINPTRGYVLRSALEYAPPWLLSDVTFVRYSGQIAYYAPVRPGWVAAVALQLGTFFNSASLDQRDFLPPEERFYAGGATSVRGYDRNELGPGVWVAPPLMAGDSLVRDALGDPVPDTAAASFVPTGGTSLIVANLELRMPSPFLGDILRFAAFVDAGSVAHGGLWDTHRHRLRITPGAGVRLQTPVGPVRVDLAYNPHRLTSGPLFLADRGTDTLVRVRDDFRNERDSFLGRLRLHLAVGQAF